MAFNLDFPTMLLDYVIGNGESEAYPFPDRFGRKEGVPDVFNMVLLDSASGAPDRRSHFRR